MSDFSYVQCSDGFFAIFPNTSAAVAVYTNIVNTVGPRMLPAEFRAFRSQARKAGYSVSKGVLEVPSNDDELLAELA